MAAFEVVMRHIGWALLMTVGCGAPTPPSTPPPPAPVQPVPSAPAGPTAVVGPLAVKPVPDQPAATVVELEAIATRVKIPLPLPALDLRATDVKTSGAARIVSVSASPAGDVWLVDARDHLFVAKGQVITRQARACPKLKEFSPLEVRASSTHVVVRGVQDFETAGVPRTEAVFGVRAKASNAWDCRIVPNNYESQVTATLLPDGYWALGEEVTLSEDGRKVPLPPREPNVEVWEMQSRDHGWLVLLGGEPWERRGDTWIPRPVIDQSLTVKDLWIDSEATPWIVGERLFGFFRDGRWHLVEVPDDFTASHITGLGPNDVWMASESTLYHYDGQRIAVTPMPVEEMAGIEAVAQSGHVRWRRAIADSVTEGACTAEFRFASDASSVVMTHSAWQQPTRVFALSAKGEIFFRDELKEPSLYPFIDDGKATLEDCANRGIVQNLPPLVAPEPASATPPRHWLEVNAERLLDVPVRSFAVSGPRDASALVDKHLWRFDGARWRNAGLSSTVLAAKKVDGVVFEPAEVDAIFGGPGALWAGVYRNGMTEPQPFGGPQYLVGLHVGLAKLQGNSFSELVETRPAFSVDLSDRHLAELPLVTVLANAAETVVCHRAWCQRVTGKKTTDITMPTAWLATDMTWVEQRAWAIGTELVRIEGDAAVVVDPHVKLPKDTSEGSAPRVWGAAKDDVWWVDTAVHRHDGTSSKVVSVPLAGVRDVGGTGPNDVWIAGDEGVAHFDGTSWARVVGLGMPRITQVEAHDGVVWLAGESGVYRVAARGSHRMGSGEASPATTSVPPQAIVPRTAKLDLERVTLRPAGRPRVDAAYEVASKGDFVWVRDDHGVVSFDGRSARTLLARKAAGGWTCQQCLAPSSSDLGYVLGGAVFEIAGTAATPKDQRLDHMLAIATSGSRVIVGGGSERDGAPSALDMNGGFNWGVPEGCYAAVSVHADETWLAGGSNCKKGDYAEWPQGNGELVHTTATGVTRYAVTSGPLLGVVAVGPGHAWAAGLGGTILHVQAGKVERYQVAGAPRLRAAAYDGTRVWFAGDDRTLLRAATDGFERIPVDLLPARASITSLACRGSELWLASADGLLRTGAKP